MPRIGTDDLSCQTRRAEWTRAAPRSAAAGDSTRPVTIFPRPSGVTRCNLREIGGDFFGTRSEGRDDGNNESTRKTGNRILNSIGQSGSPGS